MASLAVDATGASTIAGGSCDERADQQAGGDPFGPHPLHLAVYPREPDKSPAPGPR
jgi:hypothetical protein